MATYASPDGAAIRDYTKLNGIAFGLGAGVAATANTELEALLAASVDDGEVGVFLRIGESYFTDSSLNARQVRAIQMAVAFRTAVVYLRELRFRKVSGTFEPLLVEEGEAIGALIEEYENQAALYEELATGAGTNAGAAPFALPSVTASTFTAMDGDRSPSERFALLDERDNIGAWDTANG